MVQASPSSAKSLLRAEMRARRRALAAEAPEAAARAAELLPAELLGRFAVVSGYRPQGAEIDPGPLMRRLAGAGARLTLPAVEAGGKILSFRVHDPSVPLSPDSLGILSPPSTAETLDPDLIITPLVAFDLDGHRLGQGGGFYDRAIAALRARKSIFVLGLAYAGQQAVRIPAEPHDQTLDAILTEKGYIPVRKDI